MRFLILNFILLSQLVHACQCDPLIKISREECSKYDVIFQGKVDSITPCNGYAMAFFTIDDLFKGDLFKNPAVMFDCSSDCLMDFQKGETWIVYAKVSGNGRIEVNLCSHSRKFFKIIEQDYNTQNHGLSFQEEIDFLTKTLGIKALGKPKDEIQNGLFNHENIQPSGFSKLWLLGISTLVLLLFYYLFNKYFR